jgi:hypothetical protein
MNSKLREQQNTFKVLIASILNLVLKLILEINSDDVSMHFLTRIFSLIAPSFLLLIERKFAPSINRNFPSFKIRNFRYISFN